MQGRKPNFGPRHDEPAAGAAPPMAARDDQLRVDAAPASHVAPMHPAGMAVPVEPSATVARRRMSVHGQGRARRPPSETEQARRRMLLFWTKWLLPAAALVLLGSIAAWPELDRSVNAGRSGYQAAGVNLDTGRMLGARYHGLDVHGRPYMITADEARQVGPDHIDLVRPVGDSLTQSGSWMLIRAHAGVYMPHTQILDLFGHVTLYRDDGTLMNGPTAVMDVKRGIVASDDWVHAEGPFGVLDAQGELLSQREGIAQFRGPARMILNDDRAAPSRAKSASPSTTR
jgi:lipopolysaccharide export system protein LptC